MFSAITFLFCRWCRSACLKVIWQGQLHLAETLQLLAVLYIYRRATFAEKHKIHDTLSHSFMLYLHSGSQWQLASSGNHCRASYWAQTPACYEWMSWNNNNQMEVIANIKHILQCNICYNFSKTTWYLSTICNFCIVFLFVLKLLKEHTDLQLL